MDRVCRGIFIVNIQDFDNTKCAKCLDKRHNKYFLNLPRDVHLQPFYSLISLLLNDTHQDSLNLVQSCVGSIPLEP